MTLQYSISLNKTSALSATLRTALSPMMTGSTKASLAPATFLPMKGRKWLAQTLQLAPPVWKPSTRKKGHWLIWRARFRGAIFLTATCLGDIKDSTWLMVKMRKNGTTPLDGSEEEAEMNEEWTFEKVFENIVFRMPTVELRVVEEHSECLFFIQRLLARGKLALEDFKMIHYDSWSLERALLKKWGGIIRKKSFKIAIEWPWLSYSKIESRIQAAENPFFHRKW